MLYLITDTHLGHQNMLKSCSRPARFTNLILDNCRKMVKSEDTLIHLGDVAWNAEELMRFMKLPGRKVLVPQNRFPCAGSECGFEVTDRITVTIDPVTGEYRSEIEDTLKSFDKYIASQTLALEIVLGDASGGSEVEWAEGSIRICVRKQG